MNKYHEKSWLIGKEPDAGRDWGQEKKGMTEDEMAGWHHWLDGHEFGWTLGVGDGQGGMACCNSWGCKESDTTERLNWTELIFLTRKEGRKKEGKKEGRQRKNRKRREKKNWKSQFYCSVTWGEDTWEMMGFGKQLQGWNRVWHKNHHLETWVDCFLHDRRKN